MSEILTTLIHSRAGAGLAAAQRGTEITSVPTVYELKKRADAIEAYAQALLFRPEDGPFALAREVAQEMRVIADGSSSSSSKMTS